MEAEIYKFKTTISQYDDGRPIESIKCVIYFTSIFHVHESLVHTHNFLRSKGATELVKSKHGKFIPMRLRRAPPIEFIASLPPTIELSVKELSYFEENVETVVEYSVRRIPSPVNRIKGELLRFKPTAKTTPVFDSTTVF
jgi:hypothetical protein